MRKLGLILIISCILPLFSAEDPKQVGDYTFELKDNAWVMTGLAEDFLIEEGYVCKYQDDIWNKWYNSGDELLRQILDLGPNIVFKMKSSVDGQEHIFSVSDDGKPIVGVLAKSSGFSRAAKIGMGVGGGSAAVLIINNADSDDEASKTKR